jgi:Flp pilus assembly protein TadD
MNTRILLLFLLLMFPALSGCTGSAITRPSLSGLRSLMQDGGRVSAEDEARSQFAVANSRLAEERGDLQKAADMYREAISINPHNSDALWRLALLHIRQNEFEMATAAFENAIEVDPQNPALCADFGYHLYLAGDPERAEKYLRNAVRLTPGDKRACNNLGLVLAALGRDEESLAAFLDAGCKQAEAQSNLAIAQLLRLDSKAAAETLKTSLSLDPGNPRAISALQQLTAVEQQSFSDGVTRSGYATMD